MKDYEEYKFNQKTAWFSFLDKYWGPKDFRDPVEGSTMRGAHTDEDDPHPPPAADSEDDNLRADINLREDIVSLMFNAEGSLNSESALNKVNPPDPTGDECTCSSIKNYRRDTRARRQRGKSLVQKVPFSSPFDDNQGAA